MRKTKDIQGTKPAPFTIHFYISHILMFLKLAQPSALVAKILIPRQRNFSLISNESTLQRLICNASLQGASDRSWQRTVQAEYRSQSSSLVPMNCHLVAPHQRPPALQQFFFGHGRNETRLGVKAVLKEYQIKCGKGTTASPFPSESLPLCQ